MNCKNLKYRTKKGKKYLYCTLLKQEITFDNCRDCANKEYKIQKCTVSKKYCAKIKKNPKIVKLERNRKSVFTTEKNKCMFCHSTYKLTWHEIYAGKNRQNSMKYDFCLRMCLKCHQKSQEDTIFNDFWHKMGQEYFEFNLGSREDFIRIFGRSYL